MNRTAPRALIVEDDQNIALALSMLFALWEPGFLSDRVVFVSEAIERLAEPLRYDLVVLDLMLPDGSGVEVLRYIRNHEISIPVAVSTASPVVEDDVVKLNPDWIRHKPMVLFELKGIVLEIAMRFREGRKPAKS